MERPFNDFPLCFLFILANWNYIEYNKNMNSKYKFYCINFAKNNVRFNILMHFIDQNNLIYYA